MYVIFLNVVWLYFQSIGFCTTFLMSLFVKDLVIEVLFIDIDRP